MEGSLWLHINERQDIALNAVIIRILYNENSEIINPD